MLKASKLDKWNRPIRPMIWIQLTNYKSKPRLDERHRKLTNFLQFVYGKEQHQRTKRENSSKTQNEIEVYCPYERRKQIDRFFLLSFQYWLLLFTMCVWEPIQWIHTVHSIHTCNERCRNTISSLYLELLEELVEKFRVFLPSFVWIYSFGEQKMVTESPKGWIIDKKSY